MRLIDHAAGRVGAQACREAGFDGAIRYLANSPDRGLPNKILLPEEARGYLDRGMPLVSNWQKGKGPTADWRRGFDGGAADARAALDHHFLCGGSGWSPIFFSIDDDVSIDQWNDLCAPYLRGAASVLDRQWVGMYGGSKQCAWALEDDLVGHSTTPGKRWLWQTRAWSGQEREAAAVLFQARIDQDQINGIGIDVNETWADDFGQWQLDRRPAPPTGNRPTPNRYPKWSANRQDRQGAEVLWWVLHTQEGNGTAESLAQYLGNPAPGGNPGLAVSYHYCVDNGTIVDVVPTEDAAWCLLGGNNYSINLVFAGSRASWSRDDWFRNAQGAMDIAAMLAADDCAAFGLPVEFIGPDGVAQGRKGIIDHYAYTVGAGSGSHTDVGRGFPWDYFISKVREYSGPAEEDDMAFTDDDRRKVTEIWEQLRGPGGKGWPQLGQNANGENLTLVDAIAILLKER